VDDYPAEALRANAQGATSVLLSIGVDGRVANCTVAGSSGSPALDAATCRILRARTRYLPARDSHGSVIVSGDSARIVWRLPAR
jgi:protein TonB